MYKICLWGQVLPNASTDRFFVLAGVSELMWGISGRHSRTSSIITKHDPTTQTEQISHTRRRIDDLHPPPITWKKTMEAQARERHEKEARDQNFVTSTGARLFLLI